MREYGNRSSTMFPVSVDCSSHSLGEQGGLMSEQGVAHISRSAEFGDNLEYVRPLLKGLDQVLRERVDLTRSRCRPCQHISVSACLAGCGVQLLVYVSINSPTHVVAMVEIVNPP